jgi:hypothetical protein
LWKFDSPFIYDALGLYVPKGVTADMESRYGESPRKLVSRVVSESYGWRRLIKDYDKAKRKTRTSRLRIRTVKDIFEVKRRLIKAYDKVAESNLSGKEGV